MLNNEILNIAALALRPDGTYTPFSGDAIKYALEMTLLGMGMIFAVLGILWGVLALFKVIFARPKKDKAAKKAVEKTVENKAEPTPAVESVPAPVASNDDGELIAILTAAIIAYESEQNPDVPIGNFRVVSYRRANGGRSWNAK